MCNTLTRRSPQNIREPVWTCCLTQATWSFVRACLWLLVSLMPSPVFGQSSSGTANPALALLLLVGTNAPQETVSCTQVRVPEGTAVVLFTTTDLSTKHAKEGQEIELRVDGEVRVGDCVVIARGSVARGHVTKVKKPKSFGRSGKLEIIADKIESMEDINLGKAAAEGENLGDTMKDVLFIPGGGGILVAPVLLPLRGGHAEIPAGTGFNISLPPELVLDGSPHQSPSSSDARLIIFRTPSDPGSGGSSVSCGAKHIYCFERGKYMEIILSPGKYNIKGFGTLALNPGEVVYLRQILARAGKDTLVQTGGGIFDFFLPRMKALEPSDAEKRKKNDVSVVALLDS